MDLGGLDHTLVRFPIPQVVSMRETQVLCPRERHNTLSGKENKGVTQGQSEAGSITWGMNWTRDRGRSRSCD